MLLQRNNNPKRETYRVKYRVCTVLTDAPHTIRHGHVWAQRVTAGAGGGAPLPRLSIFTHCAHEHESEEEFTEQYC